jgi:hypothetical protein
MLHYNLKEWLHTLTYDHMITSHLLDSYNKVASSEQAFTKSNDSYGDTYLKFL